MDMISIMKILLDKSLRAFSASQAQHCKEAYGAYPDVLCNSKKFSNFKPVCVLQHAIVSTTRINGILLYFLFIAIIQISLPLLLKISLLKV